MKKIIFFYLIFATSLQSFANNGFLDLFKNTNNKKGKTLIIFYRPDCQYCQQMEQSLDKEKVFSENVIKKYNVQILDISTPEGRLMADKFNVHAVPTIINYDNETGLSKTIKGFGNVNKFAKNIDVAYSAKSISNNTELKNLLVCGDGTVNGGESCDDGNTTNGDGCSATCTVEAGFNCVGSPSVCTSSAICGNGIVSGGESCDDGNLTNGDGCNATCTVEVGFNCVGSPSVCTPSAICGNGIVSGGESCDDGNLTNGDGCNATCTVEVGFNCVGSPSVCTPSAICGNGIVSGIETCDDGNLANGDGCNATCTVEVGFNCVGSPSVCMPSVICGDGIISGSEQCDDGNTTNGDGCSATCNFEVPINDNCAGAVTLFGTTGTVNGQNISATTTAGVPGSCTIFTNDVWFTFTLASDKIVKIELNGPSIIDPVLGIYSGSCASLVNAACDDDSGPGTYSLIQINLPAGTYYVRAGSYNTTTNGTFSLVYDLNFTCGNSILELNEECDDGNNTNGDGCSSTCLTENAGSILGVAINTDATRAAPSAMLDVKSFNKGILVPRMSTTQRGAIASPAKGLLVFDITTNTFWYFGLGWTEIGSQGGQAGGGLPTGTTNQTLRNNGTNWVANNALQNDGTNVTVTGQIKINGGSPASGKVLTSDAAGLAVWQTPNIGSIAFKQTADSNRTLFQSASAIRLHFGSQSILGDYNIGAAFNNATDEFVAPSNGLYSFTFDLSVNTLATTYSILTNISVDNSSNVNKYFNIFRDVVAPDAFSPSFSHTVIYNLVSGDKVYLRSSKNSGGASNSGVINGGGGSPNSFFMGYKLN